MTAATVNRNARRALDVSRVGRLDPSLIAGPALVDPASAFLHLYDRRPRTLAGSGAGPAHERHAVVSITAGTLALAFVNAASSEAFDDSRALVLAEADRVQVEDAVRRLGEFVESEHDAPDRDYVRAGVIREWSGKSRQNMLRTVAGLDLRPLMASGDPLGMVTLTLPGEWLSVAPDNDSWQVLVRKFRKRFERAHGRPLVGLWKKEFQRRGAPHLHILCGVPAMTVHHPKRVLRAPRIGVFGTDWTESRFELWLSEAWAAVVDHKDPVHRARHLAAGTGVDFSKSPFMNDGVSLARYFLKHGSKTMDDKEYQHSVPEAWAEGAGRFWGTWGLSVVAAGARVSEDEGYRVKRVLRRWDRANSAHFDRRRRRSLGMAGRFGAWVLVKDPVRFVGQVLTAAGVRPMAEQIGYGAPVVPAVTMTRRVVEDQVSDDVRCDFCGSPVAQPGEAFPPFAQRGPVTRHILCTEDDEH